MPWQIRSDRDFRAPYLLTELPSIMAYNWKSSITRKIWTCAANMAIYPVRDKKARRATRIFNVPLFITDSGVFITDLRFSGAMEDNPEIKFFGVEHIEA